MSRVEGESSGPWPAFSAGQCYLARDPYAIRIAGAAEALDASISLSTGQARTHVTSVDLYRLPEGRRLAAKMSGDDRQEARRHLLPHDQEARRAGSPRSGRGPLRSEMLEGEKAGP